MVLLSSGPVSHGFTIFWTSISWFYHLLGQFFMTLPSSGPVSHGFTIFWISISWFYHLLGQFLMVLPSSGPVSHGFTIFCKTRISWLCLEECDQTSKCHVYCEESVPHWILHSFINPVLSSHGRVSTIKQYAVGAA